MYMAPLAHIIRAHDTNNTQLILSLTDENTATRTNYTPCMTNVANWMRENFLKLNTDKTEIMIF